MNGWIKISRRICDWEWFDNPLMVKAWIWMLVSASHENRSWHGIELKRGQFITSLSRMAEELNISIQQARTLQINMQNTREITLEHTNRYTIVTVCKYETYQCDENDYQQEGQQAEQHNEQQAINTPANNIGRINKEKKDNLSKESLSKESSRPYGEAHFLADIVSLHVDKQTAVDWIACRELKKLPFTRTAFEATKREVLKIPDRTPQELIQFAAENGWGKFKAEYWYNTQTRQHGPNSRNTSSSKEILGNGIYESTI